MTFQVFSRNKDEEGDLYRLILVYNQVGNVESCHESSSLNPYQLSDLRLTHKQLPGFRLSPSEYKHQREVFARWLVQGQ